MKKILSFILLGTLPIVYSMQFNKNSDARSSDTKENYPGQSLLEHIALKNMEFDRCLLPREKIYFTLRGRRIGFPSAPVIATLSKGALSLAKPKSDTPYAHALRSPDDV